MYDPLEFRVVSVDEASPGLKSAETSVKNLGAEAEKAGASLKKTGGFFGGVTADVIKGTAAYDLAKSALGGLAGFLKSSVDESLNSAATMALVQQNFENAGITFEDVKGKVDDYSESMIKLGFDDEDTADSLSRLSLVTKDYDQALKLNQLAMDLARSKNVDLATATGLVTQVTQGNNRVLKQYGIELDDSATAADNLDSLQKKVKGSAEAFGETTQGQLLRMNNQWGNLKQAVGDEVTPVLGEFMSLVSDNMPAITNLVASFAVSIAKVGGAVVELARVWAVWTNQQQQTLDKGLEKNLDQVADRFNEAQKKMGKAMQLTGKDISEMDAQMQKSLIGKFGKGAADAAKETEVAALKFNASFSGIGVSAQGAGGKVQDGTKKIAESLKGMSDTYEDTVAKAEESLFKLEEDHQKNTASITENIENLQTQLTELKATYEATVGGFDKSEAERAVEEERQLVEMRKQIAEQRADLEKSKADGGDNTSKEQSVAALEAELAKREQAFKAYTATQKGLDDELSEARRRADLTDFQRFIEDLTVRRTEAETDHTKKMEALQSEIVEQQTNLEKERVIFGVKKQLYIEVQGQFQQFHDSYTTNLANMNAATQKSVDDMKLKLTELQNILASIESAKKKAGIFAAGGFTETTSGGGGGAAAPAAAPSAVSVNLGGVTIQNEADEDRLVDKIVRELQLSTLGSQ